MQFSQDLRLLIRRAQRDGSLAQSSETFPKSRFGLVLTFLAMRVGRESWHRFNVECPLAACPH